MKSIARIFANAFARRIACVVVALLLTALGVGKANAQQNCASLNVCPFGVSNCSQGEAYASAMAEATCYAAQRPPNDHPKPVVTPLTSTAYQALVETMWGTTGYGIHYFNAGQTCAAQPDIIGSPPASTYGGNVRPGSITCASGCTTVWLPNGDDTWTGMRSDNSTVCTAQTLKDNCGALGGGRYWNAYMQACEPPEIVCEGNQTKDPVTGTCGDACPAGMVVGQDGKCQAETDTCPAGQIRSPDGGCLPGDGQCASGEVRKNDGTCGRDSDGDGQADDDDDDPNNDSDKPSFSGGDTCDTPPSCSGDPILCGQARIQWRIDCNTRKPQNVTGGACNAMPLCVGKDCNAVHYSQLLMQWRTACAVEKLALASGGGAGGDTTAEWLSENARANKEQADALAAAGDGHAGFEVSDVWHNNTGDSFNPNMFGGGSPGTCSFDADMEIAGREITIPPALFTVLSAVGWLIVAIAYLRVGTLVARSV